MWHPVDPRSCILEACPPNSLAEAFLKKENLSFEDPERIDRGEVAAVHTHLRHLHLNEPCVGLEGVPDAIFGVAHTDTGRL